MTRLAVLLCVLLLAACSITQHVNPITQPPSGEVCIIENPAVREGFVKEYQRTLEVLGYQVRLLPPTAQLTECATTSTYVAHWSWDWFWTLGVYMSVAEIKVYEDGKLVGDARYDSSGGAANPKRIIDAEPKIRELVNSLFPRRS